MCEKLRINVSSVLEKKATSFIFVFLRRRAIAYHQDIFILNIKKLFINYKMLGKNWEKFIIQELQPKLTVSTPL